MTNEKDELVGKVESALPYLRRINELVEQREILKKEISRDPHETVRVVLAVLFAVFGGMVIIMTIVRSAPTIFQIPYKYMPLALLPTIISVVILCILKPRRKRRKQEYLEKIKFVNDELITIIKMHGKTMEVLPEAYRYYSAALYVHQVLVNARADSLKEALNLYEDQLHRWKMENAQNQLIMIASQQKATMDAIELSTTLSAIDGIFR